ncbi:MAG TPA: nuclear transport factor 2 family protein [Sphingomonas sp.]|jgi:ketosteroid isomerase-like protein|uniref:nuclear transport factor 2 family protein n=1 Tax=Sphingomonas sp. TaxID=28214 RepID=UPI002EDBAF37
MTQQDHNLNQTRRLYALSAAGDWAAVRDMLDDDFCATEAPGLPYAGTFRGKDGLRALFVLVMGMMAIEAMDLIEMTAGGDWVIVLVTMRARDADGPFDIELAEATRYRDGRVIELKPFYFDPAAVHRAVAAKCAAA